MAEDEVILKSIRREALKDYENARIGLLQELLNNPINGLYKELSDIESLIESAHPSELRHCSLKD